MWRTLLTVLLVLLLLAGVALFTMGLAFRNSIRADWARVASLADRHARPAPAGPAGAAGVTETLPEPVRRYLAAAVPAGATPPHTVNLRYGGEIRLTPEGPWMPYDSAHIASLTEPAFAWRADVAMAPGFSVTVRDKLLKGQGEIRAAIWGAVPMLRAGGPEIEEGALLRYLAELVWAPTALAPGGLVRWTPEDAQSAWAHLRSGTLEVRARFTFGADGMVREIYAPERPRQVGNQAFRTPWRVELRTFQRSGGIAVPVEADLSWDLPEGRFDTLKVRVRDVRYTR